MPGPAPKPSDQKRRRPTAGYRQLPHEGREGPLPEWPIGSPTSDEIEVWTQIWKMPQATEWERLGWTRSVARYVRIVVEAERPRADTTLRTEARQLEDRLGLTPMSMLRLRWEIHEPEPEEEEQVPKNERKIRAVDPEAKQ